MCTVGRLADTQCQDNAGALSGASSQACYSKLFCCRCTQQMHAQPSNVCECEALTYPPSRTDLSVCRSNVHRSKVSFVSLLVMTNTIFCSSPRTSQSAQQQLSWRPRLIFEVGSFCAMAYRASYPTFAPALCSGSQSGQYQSKP